MVYGASNIEDHTNGLCACHKTFHDCTYPYCHDKETTLMKTPKSIHAVRYYTAAILCWVVFFPVCLILLFSSMLMACLADFLRFLHAPCVGRWVEGWLEDPLVRAGDAWEEIADMVLNTIAGENNPYDTH